MALKEIHTTLVSRYPDDDNNQRSYPIKCIKTMYGNVHSFSLKAETDKCFMINDFLWGWTSVDKLSVLFFLYFTDRTFASSFIFSLYLFVITSLWKSVESNGIQIMFIFTSRTAQAQTELCSGRREGWPEWGCPLDQQKTSDNKYECCWECWNTGQTLHPTPGKNNLHPSDLAT